jgi:hypothetical protein
MDVGLSGWAKLAEDCPTAISADSPPISTPPTMAGYIQAAHLSSVHLGAQPVHGGFGKMILTEPGAPTGSTWT